MKTLVKKLTVTLGLVLIGISAIATTTDPPSIEKIENETNVKICCDGAVNTVAIAECCEYMTDFNKKRDNALSVLKTGCDQGCKVSKAGDYTFVDFVNKKDKHVARLISNENEKILMLVSYEFKNLK